MSVEQGYPCRPAADATPMKSEAPIPACTSRSLSGRVTLAFHHVYRMRIPTLGKVGVTSERGRQCGWKEVEKSWQTRDATAAAGKKV
jgi:hypothetical protein